MATATVDQVLAVDDAINEVVNACTDRGLTPMQAARECESISLLSPEELMALAVVGLARIASDRVPKPGPPRKGPPPRDVREVWDEQRKARKANEARAVARRDRLYRQAKDSLASLYQGRDGQMRSLYEFTAEDHRHRLKECESMTKGWRRSSRFHQEAMTALKREEVARIARLSVDEQERLRGLL